MHQNDHVLDLVATRKSKKRGRRAPKRGGIASPTLQLLKSACLRSNVAKSAEEWLQQVHIPSISQHSQMRVAECNKSKYLTTFGQNGRSWPKLVNVWGWVSWVIWGGFGGISPRM